MTSAMDKNGTEQDGSYSHYGLSACGRDFVGAGAPPGFQEKIEVMAARAARGFPLFRESDRMDYASLTTAKLRGSHTLRNGPAVKLSNG